MLDEPFRQKIVETADRQVGELLETTDPGAEYLAHRELMKRAKLLVSAYCSTASRHHHDVTALRLARRFAETLHSLQTPVGLFIGGVNVDSPPDSAFTINDVADAYAVLALEAENHQDDEAGALRELLAEIANAAKPPFLRGGIHTPNHRWELSAALARLQRSWPDPALIERIAEWLAETVDINSDGFYSERSANYAAHVSNPSLAAIADVLARPELLDIVERNLEMTLDLIRPDGQIETIQSRRQDQKSVFLLSGYLLHYRRFAIDRARGDFAWAAGEALAQPIDDAGTALTELLLHPQLGETLPAAQAPASTRRSFFPSVGLAAEVTPRRTLVVYGGSDYGRFRQIRSGLATNPTLLRLFAGHAILDSVRLSRDFFGLGPFRADEIAVGDDYTLTETIAASYYQPLVADFLRPDGAYALGDEGRFSASMDFGHRASDEVAMTTSIRVHPTDYGADLAIEMDCPDVAWALELTFRTGGEFEGVRALPHGGHELVEGVGSYRVEDDTITFGPGNGSGDGQPAIYRPGQDYEFLGGTDAARGEHVYITGRAPGSFVLSLRANPQTGR